MDMEYLDRLYQAMLSNYYEWSNTPRPTPIKQADRTDEELKEIRIKHGSFRDSEWVRYCDARDKYWAAYRAMYETGETRWKN
jgi:hypothetical protein